MALLMSGPMNPNCSNPVPRVMAAPTESWSVNWTPTALLTPRTMYSLLTLLRKLFAGARPRYSSPRPLRPANPTPTTAGRPRPRRSWITPMSVLANPCVREVTLKGMWSSGGLLLVTVGYPSTHAPPMVNCVP